MLLVKSYSLLKATIKLKKHECQSTGEVDDPARLWAPTSDDYRQVNVDLSEYAGKTVLISVAGIQDLVVIHFTLTKLKLEVHLKLHQLITSIFKA